MRGQVLREPEISIECGCLNLFTGEIDFCPLHEAAPRMLALLKDFERGELSAKDTARKASALVAEIEGRENGR